MTKTWKKTLLSVFLALLFVLSFGAFAACGGGGNGGDTETYTVTVMKDEITPAKDVEVQIRKGKNKLGKSKKTDDDGKAKFELLPDDYTVEIVEKSIPLSYAVPSNANLTLTKDEHNCTVTFERTGYTVKLVNPDGTPYYAAGVLVTICEIREDGTNGSCKTPVPLGTDGTAFLKYKADNYHVQIQKLPEDAKFDCDKDNYYTGENFSATVREMTIVITTVSQTNLSLTTKMTAEEKTEFAKTHANYTEVEQQYDAYKFTKEIASNATASFTFTPEMNGVYHLFKTNLDTLSYVNENVSGGYLSTSLVCEEGKPYTFTVTNNGIIKTTVEFVLTKPFSSFTRHSGTSGTLNLTVGSADTYAIVEFTPDLGAAYTATVQGSVSACVKASGSNPNEFIKTQIPESDYTTGASDNYAIPYGYSSPIYFAVAVKEATAYPVEVTLKIEKGADSTFEYATVQETLIPQTTKPEGVLCGIPMDGTSTDKIILNESDNFYHYGTADGPVVYVKLTKPIEADRFSSGCSLAYAELIDSRIAKYTVNSEKDGAILTTDYTKFLRGFTPDKYVIPKGSRNLTMPNKSVYENEKCYANYVNEDGAYPLTEELKTFLENFYEENKDNILGQTGITENTAQANDAWLFPCYYYGEAANTPTDAIVGEYTKFIKGYDGGKVIPDPEDEQEEYSPDAYKLVVTGTAFTIYNKSGSAVTSGSWSKEGETYTFTVTDGYTADSGAVSDLHFTVAFNASTGHITLSGVENTVIVWEFEAQA